MLRREVVVRGLLEAAYVLLIVAVLIFGSFFIQHELESLQEIAPLIEAVSDATRVADVSTGEIDGGISIVTKLLIQLIGASVLGSVIVAILSTLIKLPLWSSLTGTKLTWKRVRWTTLWKCALFLLFFILIGLAKFVFRGIGLPVTIVLLIAATVILSAYVHYLSGTNSVRKALQKADPRMFMLIAFGALVHFVFAIGTSGFIFGLFKQGMLVGASVIAFVYVVISTLARSYSKKVFS